MNNPALTNRLPLPSLSRRAKTNLNLSRRYAPGNGCQTSTLLQNYFMQPFDWGVFKPMGGLILTGTAAIYILLIVVTIRRWSCAALTARHHWTVRVIGFVAIGMMVFASAISVMIQLTSAHYQGTTHAPAVAIIIGVWLSIRIIGRPREQRSEPDAALKE